MSPCMGTSRPGGATQKYLSAVVPQMAAGSQGQHTHLALLILLGQPTFLEVQQVGLRKGERKNISVKGWGAWGTGTGVPDRAHVLCRRDGDQEETWPPVPVGAALRHTRLGGRRQPQRSAARDTPRAPCVACVEADSPEMESLSPEVKAAWEQR